MTALVWPRSSPGRRRRARASGQVVSWLISPARSLFRCGLDCPGPAAFGVAHCRRTCHRDAGLTESVPVVSRFGRGRPCSPSALATALAVAACGQAVPGYARGMRSDERAGGPRRCRSVRCYNDIVIERLAPRTTTPDRP